MNATGVNRHCKSTYIITYLHCTAIALEMKLLLSYTIDNSYNQRVKNSFIFQKFSLLLVFSSSKDIHIL